MYLSWTDDVPIVYQPYTCATGNVQDGLTLMGVHVSGDPQLTYMAPVTITTEFSLFSGGAR